MLSPICNDAAMAVPEAFWPRTSPGGGAPANRMGVSSLNRRDCLITSCLALSGLAKPAITCAAEPDRIRLSLNENPLGPSPRALAAVRDQLGELCRYGGDLGAVLTELLALRERVLDDQIVIGDILRPLGSYLAQGEPLGAEFIYSEPGYAALVDAARPSGGVVVGVPLNARLENDLGAIAAKVSQRTRAIYLVNPHNPSGTVSDAAAFREHVRMMSKSAAVIVDEAYLEFDPDFENRTVMDLVRAGENVVVFRTFDKMFGLAGLGLGYAVTPPALATSLKRAGFGRVDAFDRLALVAAAASIRDTNYVATTRTKIAAERDKWHQLLTSLNLRHSDSRANFIFFEADRPQTEMAAALRAKGIEIGRAFPPLDRWVRITIGLPHENAETRAAVAELLR